MKSELINYLIDLLPYPAYVKNIEGEYEYVNSHFSQLLFAKSPKELIGKSLYELKSNLTKEQIDYFVEADKKAYETNEDQKIDAALKCFDDRIHFFHILKTNREIDSEKYILGIMIDLTESEKIKRELEFEQSLLRIFIDNIPDSVKFKDIFGNYLIINKSECQRLGLQSPLQAKGKSDKHFFDEETVKFLSAVDNEVINSKSLKIFEKEIKYQENNRRIMLIKKIPLLNHNGIVTGLCEIFTDITEEKIEQKQKQYLNGFEKILATILNYFIKNGPDKFFDALNICIRDLCNYFVANRGHAYVLEKEDYICKSFFELRNDSNFSQININLFKNWFKRLSNHEIIFDEVDDYGYDSIAEKNYIIEKKLSHIILLPIINYSLLDGYIIFECSKSDTLWLKKNSSIFIVLVEVISNAFRNYELEKYRQEVEEEMRKMMRAVDQSANMVFITDKKANIEYINPKFTEITGYSFEEVIGKKPLILQENSVGKSLLKEIWRTISQGKQWSGRIQSRSKSGELYWANVTFSPIKNLKGEITNYLGIMEDITEKMIAENRNAISQKLESIGQLAAGIAHEINTPMQYINDNSSFLFDAFLSVEKFLSALEEKLNSSSCKEAEQFKNVIKKLKNENDLDYIISEIPKAIEQSQVGIERVTKIVRAMKDFAHPGAKEKSYCDINHGINVTVTISKNEWKYYADIELNLEDSLPDVYCLQDELNQVILNMIINSAHAIQEKFDKESGKKGIIKIETARENEYAVIRIMDNGKGIKQENLNKIFDPFFTTKQVGKGTGQGLAISHDIIVNKHNGEIYVDSKYGIGTTFIIKIPINKAEDEKS